MPRRSVCLLNQTDIGNQLYLETAVTSGICKSSGQRPKILRLDTFAILGEYV